jgi:hypothetical protein
VDLWSEYDDGSGTIEPRSLEDLLLRLAPPMGLGPGKDGRAVLRFVFDLDIPLVNGRVPFHRTAYELVRRWGAGQRRWRLTSCCCSGCCHGCWVGLGWVGLGWVGLGWVG